VWPGARTSATPTLVAATAKQDPWEEEADDRTGDGTDPVLRLKNGLYGGDRKCNVDDDDATRLSDARGRLLVLAAEGC
jgi:hypothetical protein